MFQKAHYCFFNFLIIEYDPHSLPTQHIRRTDQHRIAYFISHFNCFIHIMRRSIIRIRNAQFFQHITEPSAVFGNIHAVIRCTDDLYSFLVKLFRHFEGSLSTQLNDHSIRLFMLYDLPNMFPVYGFEV